MKPEDTSSPRKIKVALVAAEYWPDGGGAERQLRQVLRQVGHDDRFDVFVITKGKRSLATTATDGTLRIHRISRGKSDDYVSSTKFSAGAFWALIREKPDILIGSMLQSATMTAGLYAFLFRRPLIVRLAGGGIDSAGNVVSETKMALATKKGGIIRSILSRSSTTIVAPARHLLDDPALSPYTTSDRRIQIPNGVDLDSQHEHHAIHGDVIWYGRNDPAKNPAALGRIAVQAHELNFVAIGRIDLEEMPNLNQLGWVERPEAVIANCKVALMTSLYEGTPNFALQALALGKWVIGLRNDALEELAGDFPECVRVTDDETEVVALLRSAIQRTPRPLTTGVPTISDSAAQWVEVIIDRARRSRSTSRHE